MVSSSEGAMIPVAVLVVVTLATRAAGWVGLGHVDDWQVALRVGLAAMLLLTASAHFGSRRADLVRMVPPWLPVPHVLVSLTGIAEIVVAAVLLVDSLARWGAAVLAVLLVVMFPANVHAARAGIGIGGRPPTPLGVRTLIQVVFLVAAGGVIVL